VTSDDDDAIGHDVLPMRDVIALDVKGLDDHLR
jgi:hypothetical protein